MLTTTDSKTMDKPTVRCSECDREVVYFNTFLSPTNIESTVCWQCLARKEKGFNAKRDFRRVSRSGVIPR